MPPTPATPYCPPWADCGNAPKLPPTPIDYLPPNQPPTDGQDQWGQGGGWSGDGRRRRDQDGGQGGQYGQYGPGQYGQGGGSQYNNQALQAAMALYQTNPSLLSQQQWTLLQNAGIISSTLPYSSAGLVNTSQLTAATQVSSGIDPTTGIPYAQELAGASTSGTDIGTMLSTTYAGLPLFAWLLIGGGAFMLMGRRR